MQCLHFRIGYDADRQCGTTCDCELGEFSDERKDSAEYQFCYDCQHKETDADQIMYYRLKI